MTHPTRLRIVIIGAGFGGLFAARTLAHKNVDVTLIDRQNFHTFTPLLYQVASSGLDPSEIAYPVRTIFRGVDNVRFLMGEVEAIDTARQRIAVRANGHAYPLPYDDLIVAAGSRTNFFGQGDIEAHAFELKTVADGVLLRNHILREFERAAWSDDPVYRQAATTLVVVGGGPTGLETAGALHELTVHVLRKEFEYLKVVPPKVILIEATDHLLDPYPIRLRQAALDQLRSLGVEVILSDPVAEADAGQVTLGSGRVIPTYTLLWMAGVKTSPLADLLDVPLVRGGRVSVAPTLEAIGLEHVYVVGDMSYLEDAHGQPYPQMIPPAKQQGIQAARNILRHHAGQSQAPFRYVDRGIMATIGRSRAVAYLFNRVPLSGYPAWIAWLGLHLLWLMGFRNQISVFITWVWNYFTYDRAVRLILEHRDLGGPESARPEGRAEIEAEAAEMPEPVGME